MRRAAKVDANQSKIIDVFRKMGASVALTHQVAGGFPDIVVGITSWSGKKFNLLIEIKDGSRPPSQRRLTADQITFHDAWKGIVLICENEEKAFEIADYYRRQ